MRKKSLVMLAVLIGILALLHTGCSGEADQFVQTGAGGGATAGGGGTQAETPVTLSEDTTAALVAYLNEEAAEGRLPGGDVARPLALSTNDGLLARIMAEVDLGPGTILQVRLDPTVWDTNPPTLGPGDLATEVITLEDTFPTDEGPLASKNELLPLAVPTPAPSPPLNGVVGTGVKHLLDVVNYLGVTGVATALRPAGDTVRFVGRDGIVRPTADAVTFFPPATYYNGILYVGPHVYTVFPVRTARLIAWGHFFNGDQLAEEAATALHEMAHYFVNYNGFGGLDDDGDQFVGGLEQVLRSKVSLEYQRRSGQVSPATVRSYSDGMDYLLGLLGGPVLKAMGLPDGATMVQLQPGAGYWVSGGESFTVNLQLLDVAGSPIGREDVFYSLGAGTTEGANDLGPHAGRTDNSGYLAFQVDVVDPLDDDVVLTAKSLGYTLRMRFDKRWIGTIYFTDPVWSDGADRGGAGQAPLIVGIDEGQVTMNINGLNNLGTIDDLGNISVSGTWDPPTGSTWTITGTLLTDPTLSGTGQCVQTYLPSGLVKTTTYTIGTGP